ncbi:hypothetical protein MKJ04_21680 [Pontibacter sp. E15-1]|nr:hypothetical protein [Pontibacter sp. E15-1]MCJ8167467.1 hypothetical protein [Pontibacter sp. E15-1]
MFRILALWCFILFATAGIQQVQAQNAATPAQPDVEMADTLRQDGKIYVVVVVLLTVLGGVLVYLISLDRKVSKLEKQLKDDLVNR